MPTEPSETAGTGMPPPPDAGGRLAPWRAVQQLWRCLQRARQPGQEEVEEQQALRGQPCGTPERVGKGGVATPCTSIEPARPLAPQRAAVREAAPGVSPWRCIPALQRAWVAAAERLGQDHVEDVRGEPCASARADEGWPCPGVTFRALGRTARRCLLGREQVAALGVVRYAREQEERESTLDSRAVTAIVR